MKIQDVHEESRLAAQAAVPRRRHLIAGVVEISINVLLLDLGAVQRPGNTATNPARRVEELSSGSGKR